MADIESSVALDISDARGSIEDLGDLIRDEIGGAFDDVFDDFQTAVGRLSFDDFLDDAQSAAELFGESLQDEFSRATDTLQSGLSDAGAATTDLGAQLSEQIETGVTEGFAQGGLVGSAALLDTGQQAIDALAETVGEVLPDAMAQAGIIGGAALLDTGEQAIGALSEEARDQLGGALTDAAKEFTQALDVGGTPFDNLDLSGAADQFEQVSSAAQDAGNQADDTADDFTGVQKSGDALGTAFQVAQGHTGGLTQQLTKAAGAAGPVVVGITAAAGAATAFAAAGLAGVAATERMTQVFGAFAGTLDHISVGGLNGDLDQLAVKAGSTSSPLKQILANLGQFTTAEGLGQEESAKLAEQFSALTLRAIALNPKLGDAGQAGQKLFAALKSGRATALTPFALGIDAMGVKLEALKLGLITSVDQALTPFQKLMAGISAATKKAGDSLGDDFNRGAEQAATRVKALKAALEESVEKLGAPLVEPLLKFGEALVPIAERVGRLVSVILQAFLPVLEALTPLLGGLADVLGVVADVLEVIAPVLAPVIAAFIAFKAATALAALGADAFAGGISRAVGAARGVRSDLATPINSTGTAMERAGRAAAGAAVGIGIGASSISDFGETTSGTIGTIGGFALAGASIGSIFPGVGTAVGAVAGAVVGLTAGIVAGGEAVDDYRAKFGKLGTELDALTDKQALSKFVDKLGDTDALRLSAGDARGLTDELKALASTSPAAAERVAAGLKKMRDEGGKPLFDPKQAELLDRAVRQGTKALNESNVEKTKAAERNAELTASSTSQVAAIEAQTAALEHEKAAIKAISDDAAASLPTVASAFGSAQKAAESFTSSIGSAAQTAFNDLSKAASQFGTVAADPGQFQEFLNNRLDTVGKFQFDLLTVVQAGGRQIADLLAAQGPEAGGALAHNLAEGIRNGQPDVALAIEGTVTQIGEIDAKVTGALTLSKFQGKLFEQSRDIIALGDNLKTIAAAGFESLIPELAKLGPEAGTAMIASLADGIDAGDTTVAASLQGALAVTQVTKDNFIKGIDDLAPDARAAVLRLIDEVKTATTPIPATIGEITPEATNASRSLGEGVAEGVHTGAKDVVRAMGATMQNTVQEVRQRENEADNAGGVVGIGVRRGVHDKARQIPDEMATTIQNTIFAIRDNSGGAYNAGFDVGQALSLGVAAGARSAQGAVNSAVSGVIEGAKAIAKSVAGIFSPSRVFANEIGRPIAEGIALGVTQGQGSIDKALVAAVTPPELASVQGRVADVTGQARIRTRAFGAADAQVPVSDRSVAVTVEKLVYEEKPKNPATEAVRHGKALREAAYLGGF